MMEASRLADSRRAEYGEDDIANSVRAVGTSPPGERFSLLVLVLAPKSANITVLSQQVPLLLGQVSPASLPELHRHACCLPRASQVWQTEVAEHEASNDTVPVHRRPTSRQLPTGEIPPTLLEAESAESETGSGGYRIPTNCPGTV